MMQRGFGHMSMTVRSIKKAAGVCMPAVFLWATMTLVAPAVFAQTDPTPDAAPDATEIAEVPPPSAAADPLSGEGSEAAWQEVTPAKNAPDTAGTAAVQEAAPAGTAAPAPDIVKQQSEIQVGGEAPPDQVLPPAPELPPPQMEEMEYAVLRTIDKLSARTHTFDVEVNKTVKFGRSLFIKLRACRKSSPIDQPESAAFLQIWEKKTPEDAPAWVFSGWMFASSPSLSAMDHPVYDVWVIDCKNAETSAKASSSSADKPAGDSGGGKKTGGLGGDSSSKSAAENAQGTVPVDAAVSTENADTPEVDETPPPAAD